LPLNILALSAAIAIRSSLAAAAASILYFHLATLSRLIRQSRSPPIFERHIISFAIAFELSVAATRVCHYRHFRRAAALSRAPFTRCHFSVTPPLMLFEFHYDITPI
jgi:hypothetical protein